MRFYGVICICIVIIAGITLFSGCNRIFAPADALAEKLLKDADFDSIEAIFENKDDISEDSLLFLPYFYSQYAYIDIAVQNLEKMEDSVLTPIDIILMNDETEELEEGRVILIWNKNGKSWFLSRIVEEE